MSDKERKLVEQIEKLPPQVQEEFKKMAEGAAIAVNAMQKDEEKRPA